MALALLAAASACGGATESPANLDRENLDLASLDPVAQAILGGDDADLRVSRPALLPRWEEQRCEQMWAFKQTPKLEYDGFAYFRRKPNTSYQQNWGEHPDGGFPMRTNSLGLREDAELPSDPDLRVLVFGDSHTDGVVHNRESYANQLEALLAAERPEDVVDVANAGVGLYTFPNYLGALLKFLPLEPDVLVVGVYGGNDFGEAMRHWFGLRQQKPGERGPSYAARMDRAREVTVGKHKGPETLAQGFNQLAFFDDSPELIDDALEAAEAYLGEMRRICSEQGIRFVVLLIPAPGEGGPEPFTEIHAAVAESLELRPESLGFNARLADGFCERLRAAGFELLDGRDAFAGASEELYWKRDQHINTAGHQRLAQQLFEYLGGS